MAARIGVLERSLIIRSISLWVLVRLGIAPLLATGGHPLFLSPVAAAMVIAVCVSLCWLQTRRWFEDLMLANLGTSPWLTGCLVVLPPLVLEFAVAQVRAM